MVYERAVPDALEFRTAIMYRANSISEAVIGSVVPGQPIEGRNWLRCVCSPVRFGHAA